MRTRAFLAGLILAALAATGAHATVVTLKPYGGAGYTQASVWDTELSSYGGAEPFYNYGGKTSYGNLFASVRVYLVKFDLSAIPNPSQVVAVNSATLRVYRLGYDFNNGNLSVAPLAQDWVQGTGSGEWDGACDGAQWYARNAGTTIPSASLVSDGDGIYHIDGVTNLANDPANAGEHFVRMAGPPGNYNNAGQGGLYTAYSSLADLQAAGGTRGCFWDSANSRLYVNKNDSAVRWYSTSDLWTTPGGTITGSYINDTSYPTPPDVPGWVQFDITSLVQGWLVNGQANYGVRMLQPAHCQNVIASSRYTDDPTLRPELVLDLQYVPEPATLALVALGGALMLRRRHAVACGTAAPVRV